MKLLVTGGSGYLGAGLLRRAPSAWALGATFLTQPISSERVSPFPLDVRNVDPVSGLFDEFRPTVVIHTAAVMAGPELLSTNADGSRLVARAAKSVGARFIHISSDVIFDGEHAPYSEDAQPAPITPYARSKALAEQYVLGEFPDALIVRTSLIYGVNPPDPRTRQALDGAMPLLFTDEYRCPIWIDDLADALLETAASNHTGILHVAGPQRLSRYEFGAKLARAFGIASRFAPAVSSSSPTPRPRDCTLDISRAQALLRTRLHSVDTVLASITPSNSLAPRHPR